MPGTPDGNGVVSVVVMDSSGIFPGTVAGVPTPLDSAEVSLKSRSHEFSLIAYTDAEGRVSFGGLVSGDYDVFARREAYLENNKKVFTGGGEFELAGFESRDDTVLVNLITASDLMINEVFYAGSDASSYYFYDQFVELYNASKDTFYLDGMVLTRQSQTYYPDQDEVDFVRAIYAYQFPGTPKTGRDYPILPRQFVVIASDAIDHSMWNSKSIDLSGADFECFNPMGSDYDNPAVPNLTRLRPTSGADYLINLSHNAVVLGTGEGITYDEYEPGKLHILIPLDELVDGIEYASNSSATKELTRRVDAGFAGLGCTKYSGQSTERRELGLDTNDSSFDFPLFARPTPGWSAVHGPAVYSGFLWGGGRRTRDPLHRDFGGALRRHHRRSGGARGSQRTARPHPRGRPHRPRRRGYPPQPVRHRPRPRLPAPRLRALVEALPLRVWLRGGYAQARLRPEEGPGPAPGCVGAQAPRRPARHRRLDPL